MNDTDKLQSEHRDVPVNPRYSRQMLFAPIGENGQRRLNQARVAVVGMGALGTVLADHMVRAGVGFVRLIDRDFVEASNLQRQMLYNESDAERSMPKAEASAEKLRQINSSVRVEPWVTDLNATNAEKLLGDVDLILDGTDNFSVRFLINDASVKNRIPWIYGGAVSSRGVSMVIVPGHTPCLRCLFSSAPERGTAETCDTAGVIAPVVHIVASYQAAEALKLLVGSRDKLHGKLMNWDLWHNHYSAVDVSRSRKPGCPACGEHRFEYLDDASGADALMTMCGRDSVQLLAAEPQLLDLKQWAVRLRHAGRVEVNPYLLKLHLDGDVRIVLFPDGRTIIQGVSDPVAAKSIFSRYIGM